MPESPWLSNDHSEQPEAHFLAQCAIGLNVILLRKEKFGPRKGNCMREMIKRGQVQMQEAVGRSDIDTNEKNETDSLES